MGAISNDWLAPLSGELKSYIQKVIRYCEWTGDVCCMLSDANDIFNVFIYLFPR